MNINLHRKDLLAVIGISSVFLILSLAGWFLLGEISLLLSLVVGLALTLLAHLEMYRRFQPRLQGIANKQILDYRQIEELFSLFALINVAAPLPAMRGRAISPDFAAILLALIQEYRPGIVVEAGSGVSTLVAGYALKQLGAGKIISLEHLDIYAAASSRHVHLHGLQDIASVILAPLTQVTINSRAWQWYDVSALDRVDTIDLLIVDGPPGQPGQPVRYPALPLCLDKLASNAVIILDDGRRPEEKELVARWLEEFPDFAVEYLPTESGTFILRRSGPMPPA